MKLITEAPVELDSEVLNESAESNQKSYYISGIFSTIGQKNRNGRVYPKHLWEKEVREYQKEISLPSTSSLMEWEHPTRSFVDPIEAIARIVELRIEGDKVIGRAKLLNNEKANKLKNLIDEGIKIGVSSRGVGEVGRGGIVEQFKLITYDCVPNPSDYAAYTTGVVEGFQDGIYINEDFDVQDGKIVKVNKKEDSNLTDLEETNTLPTEPSKEKVYNDFIDIMKSFL